MSFFIMFAEAILFFSTKLRPMSADFKFTGITIAVTDMAGMVAFYEAVFSIQFSEFQQFGSTLYRGKWGDLELLFCPASIARNTAQQNRQQFDFLTTQLDTLLATALAHGGSQMGTIEETEEMRSVGLKDPDGNSMVFKEEIFGAR